MPTEADLYERLRLIKLALAELALKQAETELHLRRQDEKLDAILLKLFVPDRMRADLQMGLLTVDTPEEVESLLAEFLAEKRG